MVTVYSLIKELKVLDAGSGIFDRLVSAGVIPSQWETRIRIYEFYLEQVNVLKKYHGKKRKYLRLANSITAEKFEISESSVYAIVSKMSVVVTDRY